jgi:hypothetical protein
MGRNRVPTLPNLSAIGLVIVEASSSAKALADTSSDRHVGLPTDALIDLDNPDCIA